MYFPKKLVAAIAAIAAIAAGTTAFAAIPDGNGVIHGCYDKKTGQLRVVDSDPNGFSLSCAPKEDGLSWNQQGPKGDRGPSNAYWTYGSATLTPNTWTTVATRSLPPGVYITSGKVSLKADGANVPLTTVQCSLSANTPNGGTGDSAYGSVSADAAGHGLYATLALENDNTDILLTSGGTVSLRCLTPSPTIAFQAVVTAIQVASVDHQ